MSFDIANRLHKTNRIRQGIEKCEARIAELKRTGIGADGRPMTPERWKQLEDNADATDRELFQFQQWQAQGYATGKLSEEEASLLYQFLGRENPTSEKFNKLSLAEKMAITKVMHELGEYFTRGRLG